MLARLVRLALVVLRGLRLALARELRLALAGLGRRLALAVLVMLGLAMMALRGLRLALVGLGRLVRLALVVLGRLEEWLVELVWLDLAVPVLRLWLVLLALAVLRRSRTLRGWCRSPCR